MCVWVLDEVAERGADSTAAAAIPARRVCPQQPGWKPYLSRGKQAMALTVREVVDAVQYDNPEHDDHCHVAGVVTCRVRSPWPRLADALAVSRVHLRGSSGLTLDTVLSIAAPAGGGGARGRVHARPMSTACPTSALCWRLGQ